MSSSLSTIPHVRLEERIIRARGGMLVRVRFAVASIEGKTHVRVIDILPVRSLQGVPTEKTTLKVLCLACTAPDATYVKIEATRPFESPYFPSLSFFTSQMTRAPSAACPL